MLHAITKRLEKCININPIQDGPFWGCSRMGTGQKRPPPLTKIRHEYPAIMKIGTLIH